MDVNKEMITNSTNITMEEYVVMNRGQKHLDLLAAIPITLVYGGLFTTGIFGNICVCIVIWANRSMHTVTNLYLYSLATSDLILLILGVPHDVILCWQQYPWELGDLLCKIRALVSEMCSYVSVLIIVVFSMERFKAVCYPLHTRGTEDFWRAARTIVFLWLVGFLCALPFAIYTKVDYLHFPPGSGQIVEESALCAMFEHNIPENFPLYELSFIIFFLIPMLVITLLYRRVGNRIRRDSVGTSVDGQVHGETTKSQSRESINRMLTAVVITFFLCWAPFHAQRLLSLYARHWEHFTDINDWLYYIAGSLYYFSATVNPILYNLMSEKFREAFKKTICRK